MQPKHEDHTQHLAQQTHKQQQFQSTQGRLRLDQNQINYLVQLIVTLIKSETAPLRRRIRQLSRRLGMAQNEQEDIENEPSASINTQQFKNAKSSKLNLPNQRILQKQSAEINRIPHEQNNSSKRKNNSDKLSRRYMLQTPEVSKSYQQIANKIESYSKNPVQTLDDRLRFGGEKPMPQVRWEWWRQYQKLKNLNEWKKNNGDKFWRDDEKRLIISFIDKGLKFGISRKSLINLAGISNSSFKRWRNEMNQGAI